MAKEMRIEQSVWINKSKEEVYDFLKQIKNQDLFSIWNMADPNKQATYDGEDGTLGFVYTWDSKNKNVGAGAQEIKALIPNKEITYEIRFERPMKNVAQAQFLIEEQNQQTKVTWVFTSPTKFPMSLLSGIFKKMLGKDMQKSLNNLQEVLR